jgi:hypothetical protein
MKFQVTWGKIVLSGSFLKKLKHFASIQNPKRYKCLTL